MIGRLKRHWVKILFAVTVLSYGAFLAAGFLHTRSLMPLASRFVDYFYVSFNSGDYDSMYRASDFAGCRCSINMEKFKGLMARVMEKLGPARKWTRTEFTVKADGRSERITLRFRVEREKGESFERIVIVKKGEEWLLTDYNVFSTSLL